MRLRSRLFLLVAGTTVPLVILAVVLGVLLVDHERETFRRGAMDRNRAFMSAVDAELRGHVTTLAAMAADATLESGDLKGFRAMARRVLASQKDWKNVLLSSPDGHRLLDGLDTPPNGDARDSDRASLDRAVASGAPAVGSVTFREAIHSYGIAVRFPVVRNGAVFYVISAVVDPRQFERLIVAQRLPDGWVSGLVDASGHFIARVPARSNAAMAGPQFLEAIRQGPEGWYHGVTVEGLDTFTAYRVSEQSGWSIGLAIPAKVVYSAALRAGWTLAFGTLAALLVALTFAWWMSRRIAQPIASLAGAARALGNQPAPVDESRLGTIEEVRELAAALNEAAAAIREREALVTREQVALRAADRSKDEFLAMLGHELRNPLSAITTSLQVLRRAPAGSGMEAQARAVMERQSRQMTRLIEDLLDISRLTMGKVRLHFEGFDLAQLVSGLVQTWEQSGRIAAGRVSVDVREAWVEGDRARIEQVLANLLDNATKFTQPGQAIRVEVRRDDPHAVMRVTDEGEGIPQEMLGEVFKLFVQGPQGTDRAGGGLGLGLALVLRLVEMHGGSVKASSEGAGKGATFTVRLPLASAVPAAADGRRQQGARSLQVIVVEDNPDGREMMRALLELHGHHVREFETAQAGIAEAHRECPDVILLDIGLPDMDGYEAARRLRADPRTAKVRLIAITGYGQPEDERKAYEAGFDVHITKPAEPQVLLDAVSRGERRQPASTRAAE